MGEPISVFCAGFWHLSHREVTFFIFEVFVAGKCKFLMVEVVMQCTHSTFFSHIHYDFCGVRSLLERKHGLVQANLLKMGEPISVFCAGFWHLSHREVTFLIFEVSAAGKCKFLMVEVVRQCAHSTFFSHIHYEFCRVRSVLEKETRIGSNEPTEDGRTNFRVLCRILTPQPSGSYI